MKMQFIIVTLVGIMLVSCKKEANEPLPVPTVQEEMAVNEFQVVCYQGFIKKDTINLSLRIEENRNIKGELSYISFEKDKNKGIIEGQMTGDTLKGVYTFISERIARSREIVFLKKGKLMIEAYGEVVENEGKTIFKDSKKLYFDSATVLTEMDCLDIK